MKITNQDCTFIKITSPVIAQAMSNPESIQSISLSAKINCCSDTFEQSINIEEYDNPTCTVCNGKTDVWTTTITPAPGNINGIYIKNLFTGEEFNILSSPLNFDALVAECPAYSCPISDLSPLYENLITIALQNWFTTHGFTYTQLQLQFCGNELIMCGFPLSFVPTFIDFNGDTLLFSYNGTKEYFLTDSAIYLRPDFFGQDTFRDGIYSVKVIVSVTGGTMVDDNCAFIDCNFECNFSDKIQTLLSEDKTTEKFETIQYLMLHYALTSSSNCGCNCQDLCDLYKQLYKFTYGDNLTPIYKSVQTNQSSDCGC